MITNKFYETPVLEYLDCESEGVLCQSGEFGIQDWTQGGSTDF